MGSTGGVAAAVRLLQAGVATLSNVDLAGLSDGQQLGLLRVVHPLVCRMEAQRSRVTGSVHRRGAVFAEGAVSRVAWLRSRLRMSDGQAQLRAAAAGRARQRLEERWLSVARTFDGAVAVQRVLDPDGGELLLATLNGLMPPPVAHDLRTPAHRRADALLDLCRLAANHTPTAGGEKPHVTVTIDWETLRGAGTATLGSGVPVTAETARRLACD